MVTEQLEEDRAALELDGSARRTLPPLRLQALAEGQRPEDPVHANLRHTYASVLLMRARRSCP